MAHQALLESIMLLRSSTKFHLNEEERKMVNSLSKEAKALRWRELVWSLIPPLSRKTVLPYLTLRETLRLDIAVTEKGDEKNPRGQ